MKSEYWLKYTNETINNNKNASKCTGQNFKKSVIIEIKDFLSKHSAFIINQKENRFDLFGFFSFLHSGTKCKGMGREGKISRSYLAIVLGLLSGLFFPCRTF